MLRNQNSPSENGSDTDAHGEDPYISQMKMYAEYLVLQVAETGFIKASQNFDWYSMHWFRDSSFVSMALLRASKTLGRHDPELAERMIDAAHRINLFNMHTVEGRIGSIKNAISIRLEDHDEFFNMRNHIPARIGSDMRIHRYDSGEETGRHSWLLQHDSIPLLVNALYEELKVAAYPYTLTFLERNGGTLLGYMTKIVKTECADAWEERSTMLHAYDVAAVYSGIKKMIEIKGDAWCSAWCGTAQLDKNMLNGGAIDFLKQVFVRDNVIYSQARPFAEMPDTQFGVDASELYIFSQFGLDGKALGNPAIEECTLKRIESDLFAGNILPVRYKKDWYRGGGRWLLLGLRYADYIISNGRVDEGRRIIDYVADKFKGSLPEQDMINVETPANAVPSIEWLAWSYGEMLNAISSLKEREALRTHDIKLRMPLKTVS